MILHAPRQPLCFHRESRGKSSTRTIRARRGSSTVIFIYADILFHFMKGLKTVTTRSHMKSWLRVLEGVEGKQLKTVEAVES